MRASSLLVRPRPEAFAFLHFSQAWRHSGIPENPNAENESAPVYIPDKVFWQWFCRTHKSAELFFILVRVQDKLTGLWRTSLLQNDFKRTLCEIRAYRSVKTLGYPSCLETAAHLCEELVRFYLAAGAPPTPEGRDRPLRPYLTQCVSKVGLQKSTPPPVRHLILN